LSKQVADQGIRVNTISPGPFWTPLQPSGGQPQEVVATFGEDSLMGRPGQPVEIAGVFVLLASQESSFATGQNYSATGGA
ncbi:MAG: SDR family oxidoreductase, partial [Aeromonas veronii]